jgi:hypothetical protein
MREGFVSYLDELPKSVKQRKAELIQIVVNSDLENLKRFVVRKSLPRDEKMGVLYQPLKAHVAGLSEWLPTALLISMIVVSED